MKVLCILLVTLVAVSQARTLTDRSLHSSLQQITQFLHNAMSVVGRGCESVTKHVNAPVCTAMGVIPESSALELCGVFTAGHEVCLGIVKGTRTYCNTFGKTLPGGSAADAIICKAIHSAGK